MGHEQSTEVPVSIEVIAAWQAGLGAVKDAFAGRSHDLNKPGELDVYASHATGARDTEQLQAILEPLLSCVQTHGLEIAALRRSHKKASVSHVSVTLDYINNWFFVRVLDDGGNVKNDRIYEAGSTLNSEIVKLLSVGGHFAIERASNRGMSYTFSWERLDSQIAELPSDQTAVSAA